MSRTRKPFICWDLHVTKFQEAHILRFKVVILQCSNSNECQILDKYVNPCLSQTGAVDCRQPSLRSYQREGPSEYQQYYTPPSYSRDESLPIIQGNQQYYTTNFSRGAFTRVFQENQHDITARYSSKHVFPGNHHVYALSNHYVGEKSVQSYSSDHPQPFPPNHPRDQRLLPTIYHGNHPSPMVRSAGGISLSLIFQCTFKCSIMGDKNSILFSCSRH